MQIKRIENEGHLKIKRTPYTKSTEREDKKKRKAENNMQNKIIRIS